MQRQLNCKFIAHPLYAFQIIVYLPAKLIEKSFKAMLGENVKTKTTQVQTDAKRS
jgi:hypothetical protein